MQRSTPWVVGLLGGLALAVPAYAAPGDHIRAGDAVITPSVMTGFEYHSNAYLEDGYRDPIVGAPAWVFNPRAKVDLARPDWKFELGAGYTAKVFIDTAPKDGINVSNLTQLSNVSANLGLNGLMRSVVGFRLEDRLDVKNDPTETQTAEGNANIVTTSNDALGGLVVRPGSALELAPLFQLGVDNYNIPLVLVEQGANPNLNNRLVYGPVLDAKWRFLPKTSLVGKTAVTWNRWAENLVTAMGPDTSGVDYGAFLGKPDSLAWKTSWGLKGQVTPKLALQAEVGYGQAFYDEQSVIDAGSSLPDSSSEIDITGADQNAENFARDLKAAKESILINTQVSWVPAQGHNLIIGYRKDFQDAFFTNYVVLNYAFFRYEGLLARRVGVLGEFSFRRDNFHGEIFRADNNFTARGQVAYKANDWLSTGLSGGWTERACGDSSCQGDQFYASQYDDLWLQLGITFTY